MPEQGFDTEEARQFADNVAALLAEWDGPRPAGILPHAVAHEDPATELLTFHLRGLPAHLDHVLTALRLARMLHADPPTVRVLGQIGAERRRQDKQWGEQNHPLVDPHLVQVAHDDSAHLSDPAARRDNVGLQVAEEYEIPTAARARRLCETATADGRLTWAHILIEELAELIEAAALSALDGDPLGAEPRAEAVQLAAVAAAAAERVDRAHDEREEPR